MNEEELEILSLSKDPLVKKMVSHYRDAFFDSPIKRLRIAQLEIIEIAIGDAMQLKNRNKPLSTEDKDKDDEYKNEGESVSMKLFGDKEIFDQAMKFVEKVPVMIQGLQATEIASEITKPAELETKAKNKRMPAGVAIA